MVLPWHGTSMSPSPQENKKAELCSAFLFSCGDGKERYYLPSFLLLSCQATILSINKTDIIDAAIIFTYITLVKLSPVFAKNLLTTVSGVFISVAADKAVASGKDFTSNLFSGRCTCSGATLE